MSSDTPERYIWDRDDMEEHPDGNWVSYEDYLALERELTALRKEREWVNPVARHSISVVYDQGFSDGITEAKRLNAPDTQAITGGENAG